LTDTYRILMVAPTSFFLDYGCHVRILEEARVLQALGHHVTLITYYLGRDLPDLEIVRTRPTPWRSEYEVGSSLHKIAFDLFLSWTGLLTVVRQHFDIIHGHLYDGALIGHFLSQLRRVPLVFDFQGSLASEMVDHNFLNPSGPWYRWVRLLQRRIEQFPDAIVTSTRQSARLVEGNRRGVRRVYPLPDCVNLNVFHPSVLTVEEREQGRATLGIPAGRPVVVYLGLLAEYQGTSLLIQAARILKERGVDSHFLIMGFPGVDRYRALADALRTSDRITFTGKVPYEEAAAHLALGDLAVAPKLSATEGAGKILNYMAMGLPTVAFDTPINREYLGSLGAYAGKAANPAALATAIGSLLSNPERRATLGQALRQRASRHFSRAHFGRQLQAVYRDVLSQRSQSRSGVLTPS
jgi:glycosyltransferase involved in cell wall biosynthesis